MLTTISPMHSKSSAGVARLFVRCLLAIILWWGDDIIDPQMHDVMCSHMCATPRDRRRRHHRGPPAAPEGEYKAELLEVCVAYMQLLAKGHASPTTSPLGAKMTGRDWNVLAWRAHSSTDHVNLHCQHGVFVCC